MFKLTCLDMLYALQGHLHNQNFEYKVSIEQTHSFRHSVFSLFSIIFRQKNCITEIGVEVDEDEITDQESEDEGTRLIFLHDAIFLKAYLQKCKNCENVR